MNLQQRIELLSKLGDYISAKSGTHAEWDAAKEKAYRENVWFIPEFIDLATKNIADSFLQKSILEKWASEYKIPAHNANPKTVGIVMAGNIPLVGFHDLLSVFITGHKAMVKPSSKDSVLIKHFASKLTEWEPESGELIRFESTLKGCDAYIATGSNNSAGYFEYYFKKYPHIIRRNRTSVAVLTGRESQEELSNLADDVYQYFGLGCRNVTKIFVPRGYDFVPLIETFKRYDHFADYHKYKNNYDFNLAVLILNKKVYMSNASLLLVEDESPFSPISQLHYSYYDNPDEPAAILRESTAIQCVVGNEHVPFGQSQVPGIRDYADGIDTVKFCLSL